MSKLFASLEELDEIEVKEEVEENELPNAELVVAEDEEVPELEESMLLIMEDEAELDKEIGSLEEIDEKLDEVESAVERLEALSAVIAKHGICKSTMEAADPGRELVALGICCSYEELEDLPVVDDNANKAVEGIKETVGNALAKVGGVFKMIATKLADLGIKVKQYVGTYTGAIRSAMKMIQSVKDVSPEKFEKASIRAYTKADYDKASAAIIKYMKFINQHAISRQISDLEATITGDKLTSEYVTGVNKKAGDALKNFFTGDISDVLGVEAVVDADGDFKQFKKIKRTIADVRGVAGEMGWKVGDAEPAIKKSWQILQAFDVVYLNVQALSKLTKDMTARNARQLQFYDKWTSEQKAAHKYATASVRKLIGAQQQVLMMAIMGIRVHLSSALRIAKAYKSAIK